MDDFGRQKYIALEYWYKGDQHKQLHTCEICVQNISSSFYQFNKSGPDDRMFVNMHWTYWTPHSDIQVGTHDILKQQTCNNRMG